MRTGKFALIVIIPLVAFLLGVYFFLPPFSRPALSSPISITLTVISDDVFVQRQDSDSWERIDEKQATLEEGDWVKTSSEGRAVITFFEGSSTAIEPGTIVCVQELFSTIEGSTTVKLNQQVGQTWNRVEKLFDPSSSFEVETSAAAAVVRGTLIGINAEEDGATAVKVFDGEANVTGQGQQVTVTTGWQTIVPPGAPPSPPSQIPPPLSQLTVSIESPAWLHVVDPLGRRAGIIPPGFEVNYIPFTITSVTSDKEQMVTINEPIGGTYYIVIVAHEEGSVQLTANGTSQSGFNQQENRELQVKDGSGYYIPLDLEVDEQRFIVSLSLGEATVLEPDFIADKFYGIKYRPYSP